MPHRLDRSECEGAKVPVAVAALEVRLTGGVGALVEGAMGVDDR